MRALKSFVKLFLDATLGQSITKSIQARLWAYRLNRNPDHEPEIELFRLFLEPGMTAIDVGGYGASYTHAMAQKVDESGSVYTFEPFPRYADILRKTLQALRHKNVTVVQLALTSESGTASLTYAENDGRSLVGEVHLSAAADDGRAVQVQTTTLDEFTIGAGISSSIAAIKIDIEGAELMALKGSTKTLNQSRPLIVCEIEERHCARYGHHKRDVFKWLSDAGYTAYKFIPASQNTDGVVTTNFPNSVFIHNTLTESVLNRIGADRLTSYDVLS